MPNPVTRFFASRGFARTLGAIGRLMITSGTVILLLVAYQLWGTNLQTNKAQKSLANEFEELLASPMVSSEGTTTVPATTDPLATTTTPVDGTTAPVTTPPVVAPTIAPPAEGDTIGRISIPSIGLKNFYFVEGTGVDQLKRGAAHYPGTPLPGQKGNAAIAGHRTTYGAPLHNVDKMKAGDEIIVETGQGTFRYEMTEQRIVKPSDVSVLDDTGDNKLTLTACHPKFSARERIIVFATLVGTPVPKLENQDEVAQQTIESNESNASAGGGREAIDEFESEPAVTFPGAWWGVGCMGLWLVIRLLAWQGRRLRKWQAIVPYIVGTPFCLLMLYFFFEAFSYEGFTRAINLNI